MFGIIAILGDPATFPPQSSRWWKEVFDQTLIIHGPSHHFIRTDQLFGPLCRKTNPCASKWVWCFWDETQYSVSCGPSSMKAIDQILLCSGLFSPRSQDHLLSTRLRSIMELQVEGDRQWSCISNTGNCSNNWSLLSKRLAYQRLVCPSLVQVFNLVPCDLWQLFGLDEEVIVWPFKGVDRTSVQTCDINTGNQWMMKELLNEEVTGLWGIELLLVYRRWILIFCTFILFSLKRRMM